MCNLQTLIASVLLVQGIAINVSALLVYIVARDFDVRSIVW
jgi:hypothetical protein